VSALVLSNVALERATLVQVRSLRAAYSEATSPLLPLASTECINISCGVVAANMDAVDEKNFARVLRF
jgi:hypothetical protein